MQNRLRALVWRCLYSLLASRLPNRPRILRRFRAFSASRYCVYVDPTANIDRRAKISPEAVVGAHAGVGEGSVLGGEVHLGDHVTMGPYCYFITGHHPIPPDFLEFRDMTATHRKIVVGSGVFIGGRVTVLPGVSIGRGAAIGAGSVVAKDVPPGAIVVGNPAQIIRQRQV